MIEQRDQYRGGKFTVWSPCPRPLPEVEQLLDRSSIEVVVLRRWTLTTEYRLAVE